MLDCEEMSGDRLECGGEEAIEGSVVDEGDDELFRAIGEPKR